MVKHKEKQEKKHEEIKDKDIKDDKESKIKELTDSLQRLQAEFENYKKRCEKDMTSFVKTANEETIKKLLPILDNFELALKNCRAKDDFYKGIELIYSHLIEALHSQGLKPIDTEGKNFDPYFHEALLTEESDKQENMILEEMQKGYTLNDKVIRHSKVKVSKKLSAGPKLEENSKEKKETKIR